MIPCIWPPAVRLGFPLHSLKSLERDGLPSSSTAAWSQWDANQGRDKAKRNEKMGTKTHFFRWQATANIQTNTFLRGFSLDDEQNFHFSHASTEHWKPRPRRQGALSRKRAIRRFHRAGRRQFQIFQVHFLTQNHNGNADGKVVVSTAMFLLSFVWKSKRGSGLETIG